MSETKRYEFQKREIIILQIVGNGIYLIKFLDDGTTRYVYSEEIKTIWYNTK